MSALKAKVDIIFYGCGPSAFAIAQALALKRTTF